MRSVCLHVCMCAVLSFGRGWCVLAGEGGWAWKGAGVGLAKVYQNCSLRKLHFSVMLHYYLMIHESFIGHSLLMWNSGNDQ